MILNIKFKNNETFQKAINWFSFDNENSQFVAEHESCEWRTIGFDVQDEIDANSFEMYLKSELQMAGIENYEFELE